MQTIDDLIAMGLMWINSYEYVRALVVVSVSVFMAKLLVMALDGISAYLIRRTKNKVNGHFLRLLKSPVAGSVVLIGIALAAARIGFLASYQDALVACLKTIAIVIWLVFSLRLSKLLLHVTSHRSGARLIQTQTLPLFENLAVLVIVAGGVYLVMVAWDINVSAWLASAGVIGLALSFAAKDTLANLFAGVFILADSPYKIGDYIVLESGERGEVTHIGIRSTRLLTRDDVEITVPNSIMGNTKVINESAGPHEKSRIRIQVNVAYGSDVDQVHDLLMQVANESNDVCHEPEPRVRFRRFGDSGLEFELLAWVEKPALRGRASHFLNGAVYKRFNASGIEIPYAKQDVYIKELPDRFLK